MCSSDNVINGLRTRLRMMYGVSSNNLTTFKAAGDTNGVEYFRGEVEGLRMALAVLEELNIHFNKKDN